MALNLENTQIQARKSSLARLLAQEGITVKWQQGAKTASFNPKSRTVNMPIWKSVQPELVDMLCIHETGHALHTKTDFEKACKAISAKTGDPVNVVHSVWNVIEDVRINELQKKKYPGSRYDFRVGYTERYNRGDYGGNIDFINKQNVADRINVHFKVPGVMVNFSPKERVVVDKIGRVQMESEVYGLVEEVLELLKENRDLNQNFPTPDIVFGLAMPSDQSEEGEEGESDSGSSSVSIKVGKKENKPSEEKKEGGSKGDKKEKEESGSGASEKGDEKSEEDSESGSGSSEKGDKEDSDSDKGVGADGDSSTDEDEKDNSKSGENKASSGKGAGKGEARSPLIEIRFITVESEEKSLEKYVDGRASGVSEYKSENYTSTRRAINSSTNMKSYQEFVTNNMKFINAMVSEFEMKKNAAAFKRMVESKTGILNMNKVFSYKISEDIFKKSAHVPEGKNHGFIFLLDCSGSMQSYMRDTLNQLVLFAIFCRRIGVPFIIFSFLDGSSSCNIFELLNSSMDKKKMDGNIAAMIAGGQYGLNAGGDTPLNRAILSIVPDVEKFIAKNRVDIFNLVTLTDGGASDRSVGLGMFDPKTGRKYEASDKGLFDGTDCCLALMKDRMNAIFPEVDFKAINFNIQASEKVDRYIKTYDEMFAILPGDIRQNDPSSHSWTDHKAEVSFEKGLNRQMKYLKFLKNFASRVAQTA